MKLTKEFLDNHPDFEHDTKIEEWHKEADPNFPDYAYYVSKDGRITINNITNLSPEAWNIHVDNDHFESIASFDVETVEDANKVLSIYGLKIAICDTNIDAAIRETYLKAALTREQFYEFKKLCKPYVWLDAVKYLHNTLNWDMKSCKIYYDFYKNEEYD